MKSDLSSLIKANKSQTGNGSEEYSELDNVDESIECLKIVMTKVCKKIK